MSKIKPTHLMNVNFVTGSAITVTWNESPAVLEGEDGALASGPPMDVYEETETTICVTAHDGTRTWLNKGHIVCYQVLLYKELPESVKLEIEAAKNRPSPRDRRPGDLTH